MFLMFSYIGAVASMSLLSDVRSHQPDFDDDEVSVKLFEKLRAEICQVCETSMLNMNATTICMLESSFLYCHDCSTRSNVSEVERNTDTMHKLSWPTRTFTRLNRESTF